MKSVLKGIAAFVLGAITFMIIVMAGEFAGHTLFGLPPGIESEDPAVRNQALANVPTGAKLAVLVAWGVGTVAGAFVAARMAPGGKLAFGLSIGGLGMLGAVGNMVMIPHPVWMWIIGLLEFLPLAYAGSRLATRGLTGRPVSETIPVG